jgi:N6-adenosine-specific RNA methylase IME4
MILFNTIPSTKFVRDADSTTFRIRGTNGTAIFVAPANLRTAANEPVYRQSREERVWAKRSKKALMKLWRWMKAIHRGRKKAYDIIFADPPWDYGRKKKDCRAVMMPHGTHYPVMSLDEICALPVSRLTAEDAELWLWVPQSLLMDAIRVAAAWGFTDHVGTYSWDKCHNGMSPGMVLPSHELLLRWRRGKPLPFHKKVSRLRSSLVEKRTSHSVKPTYWQDGIDRLCPGATKLELFSRTRRKGWTVWGNEV